jgi:hypothetical protein
MQNKMGYIEGLTVQLSCEHAAIHIVNDVATCTHCGQTIGSIGRQDQQSGAEILTIEKEAGTWCLFSH